jgi:hypothetical protein
MKRREATEIWKKTSSIIKKYGKEGMVIPFYKDKIN